MIQSLLNNTVNIYTVTESISTTGEVIKTESTLANIKVRISPLSQIERYYADKNNLETTHRMYSTYSTTWDAGDRVQYNNKMYEITGITNPSEWDKFLQTDLKYVS